MAGPSSHPTRFRRLLGLAVWALLAGGLFAMHGLGTHGTGAHAALGALAVEDGVARVDVEHLAGHQATTHSERSASLAGADNSSPGSPAGRGSTTNLIGVCLAILCGVLAGVAASFRRHLGRRPLARVPREGPGIVMLGRDHDPPCLMRLSVMRC